MARLLTLLLALCVPALLNAAPIAESLVRIEATSQEPDYKIPWGPAPSLRAWARALSSTATGS